jgi:Ca-activated chloride channel family protein
MRIEFARPELLYLLLLLPLWGLLVWPRAGRGVLYTHGDPGRGPERWPSPRSIVIRIAPPTLRAASLACLVVALAGPDRVETVEEFATRGIGLGLVVDLSSSMLAADMGEGISRIAMAREAAISFARKRPYDEMSLIGFGMEAVTRVPPTTDPELVAQGVESLEVQLVRDGTNISGAVLTTTSRLLESDREPRVMVLLTDGAHNGIELPPLATARAAAALGVRIHSISIISPEDAPLAPGATTGRRAVAEGDAERETVLQGLAGLTGGQYFRASNPVALDSIYRVIDQIEPQVQRLVKREVSYSVRHWFFLLGLGLLAAQLLLRGSRWGLVP